MGMFDSFYEGDRGDYAVEWQTKAYGCVLDHWRIGDTIPADSCATYQIEVLGGRGHECRRSLATIRDNVLAELDVPRDETLPLVAYSGGLLSIGTRTPTHAPEPAEQPDEGDGGRSA